MMKNTLRLFTAGLLLHGQVAFADVLRFDGVDDQVVVPNQAQLNLGAGDFTMEVGVQSTATGKLSMLLSKRTSGSDGFILGIWEDGALYAQLAGVPNVLTVAGNKNLYDGQCHRVALSRTGTTVRFYIDGEVTGTATGGRDISSTGPLFIGHDAVNNLSFDGQIGEVRLWNVARSTAQIAAPTVLSGTEAGLVGLWEANSTAGQRLVDRSSFANAGMLGTTAQVDAQDPALVKNATCGTPLAIKGPKGSSPTALQAYPNPFTDEFSFKIPGLRAEKVHVRIIDVQGRVQYESEALTADGTHKLGANLKPGMYQLQVTRSGQAESFRLVKLR